MQGSASADARLRSARPQRRLLATIVAAIRTVWSTVAACCERARCRRLLAQMSSRELADIGISRSEIGMTRSEVGAEVERPFWHP
jgi:uncharacterized protein YjiS (DUF1127 family)